MKQTVVHVIIDALGTVFKVMEKDFGNRRSNEE